MTNTALLRSGYFALVKLEGKSQQYGLRKDKTGLEFLALDSGEKGRHFMRAKEKDRNRPQGRLTPIPDFLPPPEELIPHELTQKITVAVDSKTLKFFKDYAKKSGLKYQRIIREVLKGYARKYG